MKALATALIAASLPVSSSFAAHELFAECYGDHHGSYLKFYADTNEEGVVKGVRIDVSDDSDRLPKAFYVEKATKNRTAELLPKAYSWAFRQAMKASNSGEFYGMVLITAKSSGEKDTMYVNLNKFSGELPDAVAINGYIEPLTCSVKE